MSRGLFATRRVLWMPLSYGWRPPSAGARHCCTEMATALVHDCTQHPSPFDCPDTALIYHEPFAEYGLPIRDGGQGYLLISHCPWCGALLPPSQRDAWFDGIEAAGHDPEATDLPAVYLTADWRTPRAH